MNAGKQVLSLTTALALASVSLQAGMVTRRWGKAPKAGPAPVKRTVKRAEAPTAYVRAVSSAPTLDGKLDEPAWAEAQPLKLTRTLDGGSRASQPTEVKLRRDSKNLYIAVRAFEPLIDKLQATRRSHDGPVWADDSMEIFIGLAGRYYQLGVNAVGSTYDARAKDKSWDSGLKVASGRGRAEWVLEIAVPLARMAGSDKIPTEWTVNFNRNRQVTGRTEEFSWSPTYSGDSHVPSRFGKMLFKAPPKATVSPDRPLIPAVKRGTMEVLPVSNGQAVVRFDLSALAKGTKVYRADLLIFRAARIDGRMDEALTPVSVWPLQGTFIAGAEAKPSGKPLAVRGPWYDRLDATEAVKQLVAGKANGGFFIKTCPLINAEATCLDVYYEGQPGRPPTQVTGVNAFHRAGQTFIIWKEMNDPVAAEQVKWGRLKSILDSLDASGRVRYCVYRHHKRITADNLHQAELIAAVKPLSCWNVNGRNIDRPVDDFITHGTYLPTGHWNPFDAASLDGKYGRDCPIDRLVVRDGAKPLSPGTGLYVHTAVAKGKSYYAVVTSLDGVQNTKQISSANSLARAVDETVGLGEPVLQRELPRMPFFNFDQKRLQYVRWVGPPMVNVPGQYYNWSVGVPARLGQGVPLELNLHRDRHSYWRTHYRIERDSIALSPHDFPIKSWWYGYHESLGTLKSFSTGSIQPYTERRLLAFIDWAAGKWPVDRNRILVTGCRGGASGSGALRLGLRHPNVFNLVIAGHPSIEYAGPATATGRRELATAQAMQAVWGKVEWDLKTPAGDGLQSFWQVQDMNRLAAGLSASTELPLLTVSSSHGYAACRRFYERMLTGRRAVIANFSWGGSRYIPVSRSGTFPNAIHLDIRRDRSLLAITSPEGLKFATKGGMGQFNGQFRWRDAAETPERYEATIFMRGRGDSVADVTPRRLTKFKVAKGKSYSWENVSLDGKTDIQSGRASVGDDGLLVLKGVKFSTEGSKLVVTPAAGD